MIHSSDFGKKVEARCILHARYCHYPGRTNLIENDLTSGLLYPKVVARALR